MNLRFGQFYIGGFYHVFNRGVDKRTVFASEWDKERFKFALIACNSTQPIQNIAALMRGDTTQKLSVQKRSPLVRIIACSLVKNHYHLVLEQIEENGVSTFMQRMGTAYTKFFNAKYKRTGALFAGKYKYVESRSENQLLKLISYVCRNLEVHGLSDGAKGCWQSHGQYIDKSEEGLCDVERGLGLFGGLDAYLDISGQVVDDTKQQRAPDGAIEDSLKS